MKLVDYALEYAAKGFYVFPCHPRGKAPLTPHGHKDATTEEVIIRAWWEQWPNANIGLALKPSNLLVVDIDRHPDKPDGMKTFKAIQKDNKFDEPPPRSNTGGKGIHLFFKATQERLKCKLDGIDVKADGYVIVPPSVHETGATYAWHKERSLLELDPPECPEWLLENLKPKQKGKKTPKKPSPKVEPGDYPESFGELLVQRCAFLKHCVDHAQTLEEPDWYNGVIGVLSYTHEAPDIVHKYSREYPGYDSGETEAKIQHWQEDGLGPSTCQAIQEKCGDSYCLGCPYRGHIKSPIVLGYKAIAVSPQLTRPTFPVEALPKVLLDYVSAVATAVQCPVDYVGCGLLAVASILIGGKRRIQLASEWTQSCNIWIALVGCPSAKKSPALDKALCFLRDIEAVLFKDYNTVKLLYEDAQEAYEEAKKGRKSKPTLPDSDPPPPKPQEPICTRLSTNDATMEALSERLSQNPHGIGLVCDELSVWMRSMNQYKGGKGSDRSHYLSMWSNSQVTVDRKGKEPLLIPSPFLTMVGGIQPDVLAEMTQNGLEDGTKERFLFCYPLPNSEPPAKTPPIPAAIKAKMQKLCTDLYASRLPDVVIRHLSPDAEDLFLQFQTELHTKLHSENFPKAMEAYYGKMESNLGRLALILHEVKNASGEEHEEMVTPETIQATKQLAEYFLTHAAIAFDLVHKSSEEHRVETIVAWAHKRGVSVVSPRDVQTNKLAGCKKAPEARTLLKTAADYGYGIWDANTNRLIFVSNPT